MVSRLPSSWSGSISCGLLHAAISDGSRMASATPARVRTLAFFLELFFFRRTKPGGRTQRLAVVVQRQVAHMQLKRACRRLRLDNNGDRAAFDAVAERDNTSAGEPRVS